VKNDGTLWRLGTNAFSVKSQEWPGLRAFTPRQLGMDSGWAQVNQDNYQFTIQQTNGSIWTSLNNNQTNLSLELEPGFLVTQLYDGRHGKFRSTTQINRGLQYRVGIREDGTFRIWAELNFKKSKTSNNHDVVWSVTDFQIGGETNWLALAGGGEKVVTLKNDGTLWLWDFRDRPFRGWDNARAEQKILKTVPVQLGTHSDWISVSGSSGSLVALAADGSLWLWPINNLEDFYGNRSDKPAIRPLLDVSHKPQLLGNVFNTAQ
jgi:alpha-tubulin suppressor-like RCC1 family protein